MDGVIQKGGTVQNENMGNIDLGCIFPAGCQKNKGGMQHGNFWVVANVFVRRHWKKNEMQTFLFECAFMVRRNTLSIFSF